MVRLVLILSVEAVAVFKLLFFRSKDVADLERLIAVRPELDRAYVRRWLVAMTMSARSCGDQLVARFAPS